jgi:hypothetical protein
VFANGDCSGRTATRARNAASHHIAHCRVGSAITRDTPSADQEIVNLLGNKAPVGNVEIPPVGWQNKNGIT